MILLDFPLTKTKNKIFSVCSKFIFLLDVLIDEMQYHRAILTCSYHTVRTLKKIDTTHTHIKKFDVNLEVLFLIRKSQEEKKKLFEQPEIGSENIVSVNCDKTLRFIVLKSPKPTSMESVNYNRVIFINFQKCFCLFFPHYVLKILPHTFSERAITE